MENWHLVKSLEKSGDYVLHVVKVPLFHPSVCRLFHVDLFKLFPFCCYSYRTVIQNPKSVKGQGFLSLFDLYMTVSQNFSATCAWQGLSKIKYSVKLWKLLALFDKFIWLPQCLRIIHTLPLLLNHLCSLNCCLQGFSLVVVFVHDDDNSCWCKETESEPREWELESSRPRCLSRAHRGTCRGEKDLILGFYQEKRGGKGWVWIPQTQ